MFLEKQFPLIFLLLCLLSLVSAFVKPLMPLNYGAEFTALDSDSKEDWLEQPDIHEEFADDLGNYYEVIPADHHDPELELPPRIRHKPWQLKSRFQSARFSF